MTGAEPLEYTLTNVEVGTICHSILSLRRPSK